MRLYQHGVRVPAVRQSWSPTSRSARCCPTLSGTWLLRRRRAETSPRSVHLGLRSMRWTELGFNDKVTAYPGTASDSTPTTPERGWSTGRSMTGRARSTAFHDHRRRRFSATDGQAAAQSRLHTPGAGRVRARRSGRQRRTLPEGDSDLDSLKGTLTYSSATGSTRSRGGTRTSTQQGLALPGHRARDAAERARARRGSLQPLVNYVITVGEPPVRRLEQYAREESGMTRW